MFYYSEKIATGWFKQAIIKTEKLKKDQQLGRYGCL